MTMIVSSRGDPNVSRRWRQQVASQRRRREARGVRPHVVLSYFPRGPVSEGLIDVRRLMFVVLHDELRDDGQLAVRCAGYTASGVPCGVRIGGADQNRFEKDLTRAPGHQSRGQRFDFRQCELFTLALDLDRHLERHAAFPRMPRRRYPRWPRLWAAFEPAVARMIRNSGPELESADQIADSSADLAHLQQRTIAGLTAFPLEFVGNEWQRFNSVFADLRTVPKRQVVAFGHPEDALRGDAGPIDFNLLSSRFHAG